MLGTESRLSVGKAKALLARLSFQPLPSILGSSSNTLHHYILVSLLGGMSKSSSSLFPDQEQVIQVVSPMSHYLVHCIQSHF